MSFIIRPGEDSPSCGHDPAISRDRSEQPYWLLFRNGMKASNPTPPSRCPVTSAGMDDDHDIGCKKGIEMDYNMIYSRKPGTNGMGEVLFMESNP